MIHNHLFDPALRTADINDCENNFWWQWQNITENPHSSIVIKFGNATIFGSENNIYTPLTCLHESLYFFQQDNSFDWLLNGQGHNPQVQEQYRRVMNALGKENFWRLVASSTGPFNSDWDSISANLNWQNVNNKGSIDSTKASIKAESEMDAMFNLLVGQTHNVGSMFTYRWGAKNDLPRLFDLVNKL